MPETQVKPQVRVEPHLYRQLRVEAAKAGTSIQTHLNHLLATILPAADKS